MYMNIRYNDNNVLSYKHVIDNAIPYISIIVRPIFIADKLLLSKVCQPTVLACRLKQ